MSQFRAALLIAPPRTRPRWKVTALLWDIRAEVIREDLTKQFESVTAAGAYVTRMGAEFYNVIQEDY